MIAKLTFRPDPKPAHRGDVTIDYDGGKMVSYRSTQTHAACLAQNNGLRMVAPNEWTLG